VTSHSTRIHDAIDICRSDLSRFASEEDCEGFCRSARLEQ